MERDTEIRKMCPASMFGLVQILETSDSWKKLMGIIPQQLDSAEYKHKYTSEHVRIIERHSKSQGREASAILLEEWGIAGRLRPRMRHLLELLIQAELYRAADFVAVNILKESIPERPKEGPAAKVCFENRKPTPLTPSEVNNIYNDLDNMSYPSTVSDIPVFNNNEKADDIISTVPKFIVNTTEFSSHSTVEQNGALNSNLIQFSQSTVSNSQNCSSNSRRPSNEHTSKSNDLGSNLIEFSQSQSDIPAISKLLANDTRECADYINTTSGNIPAMSQLMEKPRSKTISFNIPSDFDVENGSDVDESNVMISSNIPQLTELLQSDDNTGNGNESGLLPNLSIFNITCPKESNESPSLRTTNNSLLSESCDKMPMFNEIMQGKENNLSGNFADTVNDNDLNYLPKFSSLNIAIDVDCGKEDNLSNNSFTDSGGPVELNTDVLPNLSILNIGGAEVICEKSERSLSLVSNQSRSTCASPLPQLSLNTVLPHFTYVELQTSTNGFDETLFNPDHEIIPAECLCDSNGRQLGSGAFGAVYLALGLLDKPVAVKKLHLDGIEVVNEGDTITKQFKNEVELLYKYKHPNLLSLLGYSCDGPTYCLLYEYISGGSLDDRLLSNINILSWPTRLSIAKGTASGVAYLHSAYETPLIHRDIKSANILLDDNDIPKLCDFGLIKLSSNQNTNTATTVFGTSAYMAPEAFRGDVSIKTDTFSFGVVLLELLTGLPPLDNTRDGTDLVTHVEENCEDNNIETLLDRRAGDWTKESVDYSTELFSIANLCLEEKKRRPTMTYIFEQLDNLIKQMEENRQ